VPFPAILPVLDRQPGLAALRLVRLLNDVKARGQCAPHQP